MPARAASSGAANNAESYSADALSSLHLRQRSVAAAAEVAARMRIAQSRDAHLVGKACGLAELLPFADARFLLFAGQPLLDGVDVLWPRCFSAARIAGRIDGRFGADRRTIGAALAAP